MTAATHVLRADALGVPERAPWLRRLAGRRFLARALVVAADVFVWGRPLGWAAALLGGSALAALQVGAFALHPSALRVVLPALAIAVAVDSDRHGWTFRRAFVASLPEPRVR